MGGTVYAYDATDGYNQRWVTTADEFQAATGISGYCPKEDGRAMVSPKSGNL